MSDMASVTSDVRSWGAKETSRLRAPGYATGSGKHNYRPEDRGG